MKNITTTVFILYCWVHSFAQQYETRLIKGWEYRKEEIGGIYEIWRSSKHDFSGWSKTNLPHCINAFDAVDPDKKYYQGETWYRTLLKVNNPYHRGRTILHFEGAGQKTTVYTYLTKAGSHVGGYDEFNIDMTEQFNKFSENQLFSEFYNNQFPVAICTDNSRDLNMMPSDLSDFNLYGGLYRYVNLLYVPAISVKYLHINSAVADSGSFAKVSVLMQLYNPEGLPDDVIVDVTVQSPEGKVVYSGVNQLAPFHDKEKVFEFSIIEPQLWSPDQPNLYTCKVTLSSVHGKQTLQERFGLRFFEFKKQGPFYLNGERLLLRGTHRHEDHAGVGAAMTEEMIRNEMRMIKEMGVNFIRLGHYQQSRIVLDACDELGILVWEEIPWCRGGLGNNNYQQQGKRMLTNLINQHYNHPSIIIWGLGNENDWPGDFDVFDKNAIRTYMENLNELSHTLDSSRKTAIRRCDFCKHITDIYSPSIWAGWYRGKYTDYMRVSEQEMKEVEHFLHVEWGASNHAGRHSEAPDNGLDLITSREADERDGDFLMIGGEARASKDGDWTETYACNLIDWHLKEQEKMDWLTGTAYWPFKDFSTPVRPENPVPYVNQKGAVERDFTKKEAYYVFQSYWTEEPMIRIYGHSFETRWGGVDEKKIIKVYSNCPEVELIVNDESLSKKMRNAQDYPAAGLRWAVILNEGTNNIKAIGYKNKIVVSDEVIVNYQTDIWLEPKELKLYEFSEIGDSITVLKAEVFDENGIKCLDAKNNIRFKLAGDGELIDNLGTSDAARVVELYNGHAYISVLKKQGVSMVSATIKNIPTQFIKVE